MSTAVAVTRESAPPIYGRQTRLALENFPAGTRRGQDPPEFVRAYALVKAAAAQANMELGVLDAERAPPSWQLQPGRRGEPFGSVPGPAHARWGRYLGEHEHQRSPRHPRHPAPRRGTQ